MFTTGTHSWKWTFTSEELERERSKAHELALESRKEFIKPDEEHILLTAQEEREMMKIVERAALKFSQDFRPQMWESIRWIAFTYFKRLFLIWSPMDYQPRAIMMTCFYLAMKVDEFFVTIEEFVANCKSGEKEANTKMILSLEPTVLQTLKYHLTVHVPFRPFEGHLLEMKVKLLLNFDLEEIRHEVMVFFTIALFSDASLLYAPSQIALAAIKHALNSNQKPDSIIREYVFKLFDAEEDQGELAANARRLLTRLDEIIDHVINYPPEVEGPAKQELMIRSQAHAELQRVIDERSRLARSQLSMKSNPVDSDDE